MLRQSIQTISTRILVAGVSFVIGILLARFLSVEDRGQFGFLTVALGIGVQIFSFGLITANTYLLASKKMSLGSVNAISLVTFLGQVTLAFVFWFCLKDSNYVQGFGFGDLDLLVFFLSVPVNIYFLMNMGVLQGLGKIWHYNIFEFSVKFLTLVGVLALIWLGHLTSFTAYSTSMMFMLLIAGLLFMVNSQIEGPKMGGVKRQELLHQLSYSSKGYLASIFGYLLLKQDLLLIKVNLPSADLGFYSVASSLNDFVYMIPSVYAFLLFPRFSSLHSWVEKKELLMKNLKNLTLIMFALVGIGIVASPYLIPLIFGSEYQYAVSVFQILLVGMLFFGPNSILAVFLASLGNPKSYVFIWGLSALLNFCLISVFLKIYGMGLTGVAVASVCSYAFVFLAQLALILLKGDRLSAKISS